MERNEIYRHVKETVVATGADIDPAAIRAESTVGALGLDSISLVELGVRLEQQFGSKLVLDDWVDEQTSKDGGDWTLQSLVNFIERSIADGVGDSSRQG
jgi:acyl carrier protein